MGKRTIKITDKELTEQFQTALFPSTKTSLNENLTSEDKTAVKSIVQKEIQDFLKMSRSQSFEKMVEGMVKDYVKKDKDLEKHIVEINKNVLTQLYKTLWTRRNFWTSELKNTPN